MRRIGLIGGMSWESTAIYYQEINRRVRDAEGGLVSADVLIHSVNFAEVVALQQAGRWDEAARLLEGVAQGLEGAGAEALLICTNTMHILAGEIEAATNVPLLHIVDVTAVAIRAAGLKRPLLLATRYTMEKPFYLDRMRTFGLAPMVPAEADRGDVHDIIFGELCCGVVKEASRERYRDVIRRGIAEGADAVILGCTEIGMLVGAEDAAVPVFDSTLLHAQAAVDFALGAPAGAPAVRRSALEHSL
ncbi:aspartate/glutamate racemase family protein [Acuticoccus mangrovi]|uniref:Aspartate/glutamate racemase family protein n=1 Tax=Acuticoccus mangrovi TaxID=2796142 RepID=A0A934MMV2_9HYPH|nr:aspartate/glutamate racemase family protein [Acuticoccus mangrovi]MBJ3777614.1 aspartate/glutamate racemase family protein [Acuticoccus mangrovi]